jgi:hypothetical protein|tara:strand:- start:698 stop:832 length:135 start_codon:yes stop_codon:yes gene_type:complete
MGIASIALDESMWEVVQLVRRSLFQWPEALTTIAEFVLSDVVIS